MAMRTALLGGILILSLVAAPTAFAEEVTFEFTGSVTSATGALADQGAEVRGTFTYDTDLVDYYATRGDVNYYFANTAANQAFNDAWAISVTVGDVTYTTASNQRAVGTNHHGLDLTDMANTDSFRLRSLGQVASDDYATLFLSDGYSGAEGTPDGVAAGTGNLIDWDLSTVLDPSLFNSPGSGGFYDAYDTDGTLLGTVDFTLDTIAEYVEPVPEAAEEPADAVSLLIQLMDDTSALDLRRRTERSLLAKLGGALRKLEDDKACNDWVALLKLWVFTHHVKALSGKRIFEDDAESLIAGAEEIMALLLVGDQSASGHRCHKRRHHHRKKAKRCRR